MVDLVIKLPFKEETQLRMDNLDEYILTIQNYTKGIYDFETISSPEKIRKAVESGKKFVFLESGVVQNILTGLFLLGFASLILLILSITLPADFVEFNLIMTGILSITIIIPGLYFLFKGILFLSKPFIVLGPEGIVYNLLGGGINSFNWEDVSMEFFEFLDENGQYYYMIGISLANRSLIRIGNGYPENKGKSYSSKEFPDKKLIGQERVLHFLFLTFSAYYNHGKYGTFEKPKLVINEKIKNMEWKESLKELKENSSNKERNETVEPLIHLINDDGKNVDVNSSLAELKEAYNNYKNKNYSFGKYRTAEQIQEAHANGKIFVLKGGSMLVWVLFIVSFILTLWVLGLLIFAVVIIYSDPSTTIFFISILVFPFILFFTVFPCIMLGLSTRMFLVIGPLGVYHRRIAKIGYFQWRDVTYYEGGIHTMKPGLKSPPIKTAQVTIILPNKKKKRFASMAYQNKEFARTDKRYMFVLLFQIYSELGRS